MDNDYLVHLIGSINTDKQFEKLLESKFDIDELLGEKKYNVRKNGKFAKKERPSSVFGSVANVIPRPYPKSKPYKDEPPKNNEPNPTSSKSASTPQGDFLNIISSTIDTLIEEIPKGEDIAASKEGSRFFDLKPGGDYDKFSALKTYGWYAPPVSQEKHGAEWDKFKKEYPLKEEEEYEPYSSDYGDDEENYKKGSFLYKFHSDFRKFPGKFAIYVGETKPILLNKDKKNHSFSVIWSSVSGRNDIFVKGSGVYVMVLRFWDDQVNPRNNAFDIEKFIHQAIPAFDSNIIKKASKEDIEAFSLSTIHNSQKMDMLNRVLYATTLRKSMEFKRKKPIESDIVVDGNEVSIRGKQMNISELRHYLEQMDDDEQALKVIEFLTKKKYFDQFSKEVKTEILMFLDARKELRQVLGDNFNEDEITDKLNGLLRKSISKLKNQIPTVADIVATAVEIFKKETPPKKTDQ